MVYNLIGKDYYPHLNMFDTLQASRGQGVKSGAIFHMTSQWEED